MNGSLHVGIDENGLGSRLGPLVVTAVLARVTTAGEKALVKRLPQSLRRHLDDSKQLVSHTDYRLGEAWARAIAGLNLSSPDELVTHLTLDPPEVLRAPCPAGLEHHCWGTAEETLTTDQKMVQAAARQLLALERRGIRVLHAKSVIVCTHELNRALAAGRNRFTVDLHAMERLILALRPADPEPLKVTCGKVGGMTDYTKFLGPLSSYLHTEICKTPSHSAYHFHQVGDVHFVQDADAAHPLVMLASLVGKYLRELLMARIAHFYSGVSSETRLPSGYHDPVTDAFVKATELTRAQRKVPTSCFERSRREPLPAAPAQQRKRARTSTPAVGE